MRLCDEGAPCEAPSHSMFGYYFASMAWHAVIATIL